MKGFRLMVPSLIIGIGIVWAANLAGLWWVTTLAGVSLGLLPQRGREVLGLSCLIGALGWGLPLVWQALTLPIGRVADVVGGIMGFGTTDGPLVIVLVLLLGLLLCLTGMWVGRALRLAVVSVFRK
jgi:hypothetical protein